MRRILLLMRAVLALALSGVALATASAVGDWGPPAGKFRCRLRLQKQIFVQGDPISLIFSVEPLDPDMSNVEDMIPYRKRGLIEGLVVTGPDGRRLPLKKRPQQPPAGRYSTVFDVSRHYDLAKTGAYSITAQYPMEAAKPLVLKSQTISLLVVPSDFIILNITLHKSRLKQGDRIPVTVNLSAGSSQPIEVENSALRFMAEDLSVMSVPYVRAFPPRMSLTTKPHSFVLDLSARVWHRFAGSRHRLRTLYDLAKPGDKLPLVAKVRGKYKGRKFVVKSSAVWLQFRGG